MQKQRFKIGVLMGGPSTEREISLVTGKAIYNNLDRKKYLPSVLQMDTTGRIFLIRKKSKKLLDFNNRDRSLFDLFFIALHGSPGEDGTVQGMFDLWGIPYTGSGVLASALAMNKIKAEEIFYAHNLPIAMSVHFNAREWKKWKKVYLRKIYSKLTFPVVLKPTNQGSAVGVDIIKSKQKLVPTINRALKNFSEVMIQEYIPGEEATGGVLEKNGKPVALPPTHIKANFNEFYDYKSKYTAGGSTHICPADFPKRINKKIQEMAITAHRALGCRGMSRSDFIVTEKGKIYILEINTIPGMTPTSLLPEAAAKAGISFSKMLDLIIKAAR